MVWNSDERFRTMRSTPSNHHLKRVRWLSASIAIPLLSRSPCDELDEDPAAPERAEARGALLRLHDRAHDPLVAPSPRAAHPVDDELLLLGPALLAQLRELVEDGRHPRIDREVDPLGLDGRERDPARLEVVVEDLLAPRHVEPVELLLAQRPVRRQTQLGDEVAVGDAAAAAATTTARLATAAARLATGLVLAALATRLGWRGPAAVLAPALCAGLPPALAAPSFAGSDVLTALASPTSTGAAGRTPTMLAPAAPQPAGASSPSLRDRVRSPCFFRLVSHLAQRHGHAFAPRSTSRSARGSWWMRAQCRGVCPHRSCAFALAPLSSRYRARWVCLFCSLKRMVKVKPSASA